MLPEIAHQPTLHNPFPQLSKVAVAPFFDTAEHPTLNGKELAMAYFNELQSIPGFEVIPVGVVEQAMRENNIKLDGPGDARRLAQVLEVDAVVVGAVTDYSPWYPPRMGLQVEWYAANPYFHPIPPGYGLPWGTPAEQEIPGPLVFEAEMALAKAQLDTQTPPFEPAVKPKKGMPSPLKEPYTSEIESLPPEWPETEWGAGVQPQSYEQDISEQSTSEQDIPEPLRPSGEGLADGSVEPDCWGMPSDWPDPRGFIPPPPMPQPPVCQPNEAPVLRHTKIYNGSDMEFTEALASYYYFRDDARGGGWQAYLQRSNDFIRFCCHLNIAEMLSARGGAGETRVVWRWPTGR